MIPEATVKRCIGVPQRPTLSSSGEWAFKSEQDTRKGEGPEKPAPFHGGYSPDGCNPKEGMVFKIMSEGLECPWVPCSESIVWDEESEKLGRFIMKLTPFILKSLDFIVSFVMFLILSFRKRW